MCAAKLVIVCYQLLRLHDVSMSTNCCSSYSTSVPPPLILLNAMRHPTPEAYNVYSLYRFSAAVARVHYLVTISMTLSDLERSFPEYIAQISLTVPICHLIKIKQETS